MIKPILIVPLPRRSRIHCFESVAVLLLSCVCCLLLGGAAIAVTNQSEDALDLRPNAPIEREISGGEKQVYRITLDAGTYLRVLIAPRNTSIESTLLCPGGSGDKNVVYMPGEHGLRFVSLVVEVSGSHRLEIRLAENAKAGRYEVKIEELRLARFFPEKK